MSRKDLKEAGEQLDAGTAGLVVVGVSVVLGTLLGTWAGYAGRVADHVITGIADLVQAFPAIVLMHGMPGSRDGSITHAPRYAKAGAVVIAISATCFISSASSPASSATWTS